MKPLRIPMEPGCYLLDGTPCAYADNVQISESLYRLQHHIAYRARDGRLFIILRGFVHDGASKGFLKRFGKYSNGALFHDGVYAAERMARSRCDLLFKEIMQESGEWEARVQAYYWAVRAFGWAVWKFEHTKRSVRTARLYVHAFGPGETVTPGMVEALERALP